MLSPRTVSLRIQNRALLKALEKYTENVILNTTPEKKCDTENSCFLKRGLDPNHDDLSSVAKCDTYLARQDTTSRNGLQLYNNYIAQLKSDESIKFEGSRLHDKHMENQIEESLPAGYSPVGSNNDFQTIVHDIVAELKGDKLQKSLFKEKNYLSRNSTHSKLKAERYKSISLEQQRAAEAQMHAPTHSHSLSKCYCTDVNHTHAQTSNKYVVQIYGRKQNIPSRLKRQRYRAESMSRHSRTVRWADNCDERRSLDSKAEEQVSSLKSQEQSEICRNVSESCETSSLRNLPSPCLKESETSLLDRVKTFREAHWSDCHASLREKLPTDHECVQHYVLNKRSFLEPLHSAGDGHGSCPICSLSSKKPDKKIVHDDYKSMIHKPPNFSSHIIVTLPKLLLDPNHGKDIFKTSTRGKLEADNVKQKSCCLVKHHSLSAKESSALHISDSLALRYQKKAF